LFGFRFVSQTDGCFQLVGKFLNTQKETSKRGEGPTQSQSSSVNFDTIKKIITTPDKSRKSKKKHLFEGTVLKTQ